MALISELYSTLYSIKLETTLNLPLLLLKGPWR
jgi:hypothetical protein